MIISTIARKVLFRLVPLLCFISAPLIAGWDVPGTDYCVGFGCDGEVVVPEPRVPRFPRPSGSEESCLAVYSYPERYDFVIKNTTRGTINFGMFNRDHSIGPGQTSSMYAKIGFEGNSCRGGGREHRAPTIRFYNSFQRNSGRVVSDTVRADKYREFGFYIQDNRIQFGHKTSSRR